MDFRAYNGLRLFAVVARHLSFTAAGSELNLTKGAVSYQIKQLERELGFDLFVRVHNGVALTEKGKRLWQVSQPVFREVEQEIASLQEAEIASLTVGASTYFASRWLAPRLATFTARHPQIRLRLQPVIGSGNLEAEGLDLMVRWGKGEWSDVEIEPLFSCPAIATAGKAIAQQVDGLGLAAILPTLTLLHDREGSDAWRDWHLAAGVSYRPRRYPLVIPDPNVRVEAVVSGQGVALNDALVADELENGRLFQISPVELPEYGYYLAYANGSLNNSALRAFRDWIMVEAAADLAGRRA
ncbi:MAG: LysR substrate-binding domain-containing protein [Chloroflexota bacterium]